MKTLASKAIHIALKPIRGAAGGRGRCRREKKKQEGGGGVVGSRGRSIEDGEQ